MTNTSRDEVAHLANLARIDLDEAELDRLAPQLSPSPADQLRGSTGHMTATRKGPPLARSILIHDGAQLGRVDAKVTSLLH